MLSLTGVTLVFVKSGDHTLVAGTEADRTFGGLRQLDRHKCRRIVVEIAAHPGFAGEHCIEKMVQRNGCREPCLQVGRR